VVAITKRSATSPRKSRVRREHLLFLAFIAPNFLLLGIFSYWPLLYQAYLSMTRWDMISPTKTFVGANNYRFMFEDPNFHQVLLNTGYFTGSVLVGSLILGLALAMLLNQRLRGRTLVRGIVFAPFVLSGAAIGLVWSYIFDPVYGLMRVVLGWVGIGSPNWLVSTTWAMPALIIVYLWKNAGYSAIIYLAGLQNIPNDLYDAAKVDGVTFFLLVTTLIFSIQAFDVIAVMTKGGPVNATTTLIWYLYQQGFVAFRAGLAAAAGMLLFVLLLVVTLFQVYFVQRRVHYS